MVARGKFFLYDSIVPALPAGRYTLTSSLALDTSGGATAVAPLDTVFNVTAPRMKLPPDQVLMTFPPANSEGAFEARLPQIVLKQKSLPWDRIAANKGDVFNGQTVKENTPWLALVVIAEGEGQIVHDQPWQDCFTEGTSISGATDAPKGSYLSVPQSTVTAIFPTVDDLIQLTHVREVNLEDTENAMGDDDGFLSVVIGNRTPQFDTANCKPKAYTACLINLEAQLGVLPKPAPPRPFFEFADLFVTEMAAMYATAVETGIAIPQTITAEPRVLDIDDAAAMSEAVRRGEVVFHDGALVDRAGATRDGVNVLGRIDATDFLDANFSALERSAAAVSGMAVQKVAGTFAGFDFPLHVLVPEKFYRFPVLTSWRFSCTGAGSFAQLMSSLDVGLLGTESRSGYKRPLAECVPDATGDSSGTPPVTALPLEIAETGHIGMPHLTRTGETTNAWYRGPFSPHQLLRNPLAQEAPFPVLAHVSDHLRMMTPDGREDVSLAVAFETGRLLAMSQPSFVAALQRWRAERFGASRARTNQRAAFLDKTALLAGLIETVDIARLMGSRRLEDLPRFLQTGLFRAIEMRKELAISTPRELVDPAIRVDALRGDFDAFLADGLGLDRAVIEMITTQPDSMATLNMLQTATPGRVSNQAIDLGSATDAVLDQTLDTGLRDLADVMLGGKDLNLDTLSGLEQFDTLDGFIKDRFKGR